MQQETTTRKSPKESDTTSQKFGLKSIINGLRLRWLFKITIMKNRFIKQTASDYDMSYGEVEWIYHKWNDKGLFYEKLEEHIKERA